MSNEFNEIERQETLRCLAQTLGKWVGDGMSSPPGGFEHPWLIRDLEVRAESMGRYAAFLEKRQEVILALVGEENRDLFSQGFREGAQAALRSTSHTTNLIFEEIKNQINKGATGHQVAFLKGFTEAGEEIKADIEVFSNLAEAVKRLLPVLNTLDGLAAFDAVRNL